MASKHCKPVNLALQGGGAHGAFTWGVLDRLLAEPRLGIEGISGSSSGAMNAVILADGLSRGDRELARQALAEFWQNVANLFQDSFCSRWQMIELDKPPLLNAYLALTRCLSPYQLNPMDVNPMRELLCSSIDFDRLRTNCPLRLFIGATQVRTGKLKIFTNEDLSVDVLLASACLPSLHQAVEIDGEAYWDGGFTGNPPVFPLIFHCTSPDIIIVIVQPLERGCIPTTVEEIQRRISELNFSSAFLREMRAIAFSKEQTKRAWLTRGPLESRLDRLNVHIIQNQELLAQLHAASRYSPLPSFIQHLHDEGYRSAELWLKENFRHVGARSTVDLAAKFC